MPHLPPQNTFFIALRAVDDLKFGAFRPSGDNGCRAVGRSAQVTGTIDHNAVCADSKCGYLIDFTGRFASNAAKHGVAIVGRNKRWQIGPNGLPSITGDITLVGLGSGAIITRDSNAPDFRLFNVTASGSLTLENVSSRDTP